MCACMHILLMELCLQSNAQAPPTVDMALVTQQTPFKCSHGSACMRNIIVLCGLGADGYYKKKSVEIIHQHWWIMGEQYKCDEQPIPSAGS